MYPLHFVGRQAGALPECSGQCLARLAAPSERLPIHALAAAVVRLE